MAEWTHCMCGDCWLQRNFKWTDDGGVEFRPPVTCKTDKTEICCFCGNKTVLGIFVRHDPATLTCGKRHGEEVDDVGFGLF